MVSTAPPKKAAATTKKSTGGLPADPNKNSTGARYSNAVKVDNRELGIPPSQTIPIHYLRYNHDDPINSKATMKRATLEIKYNSREDSKMLYPSPKRVQNAFKRETPAQKACPLDISFVCGDWMKSLEQQGAVFKVDIPKYWDIFIDCIERWNSIAMWAPFVPTMHLQKKGVLELKTSAPNLKHVMLVGPREFNVVATAQFLSPLWKTSPLDSFYIKQVTEDPYDSAAGLLFQYMPTGYLTQLKLDCKLSVIECCLLLAFSPNLVECSFGDITGPIGDTNMAFVCQELQSLKVVVDYEDHYEGRDTYLWAILDQLTAPNLRRFVVECDDCWRNASFIGFLERSQCVLEALEFLLVRIDPDSFMQVLQKCRHLRVLMYKPDYTQTPMAISPELLKALDPEEDNPFELLDDLEILALNEDALGGLQDGHFAEALRKKLYFDDLNIFRLCWFEAQDIHVEGVQRRKDAGELQMYHNPQFVVWMGGHEYAMGWEEEVETCMAVRCNFGDNLPLVFVPETCKSHVHGVSQAMECVVGEDYMICD